MNRVVCSESLELASRVHRLKARYGRTATNPRGIPEVGHRPCPPTVRTYKGDQQPPGRWLATCLSGILAARVTWPCRFRLAYPLRHNPFW
jgi:hypothetical protein